MSHRFRIPVRSKLAINKISQALKRLRGVLLSKDGGTVTDALTGIFRIFEGVLPRLGKPTFAPRYLAWDVDPDPELWNLNLEQIEEDLGNLFAEVDELRNLRMETSNTTALIGKELSEKANLAQSLVTDLRLTSGQLGQEVIVASDDFRNLDKIDQGFPTQYPMAEVNTLQGAVSLKRIEATTVQTDDAGIDVTPIIPNGLARLPTPENLFRFYEGRFYAVLGQARPEGGRWHLEEKVRPGVTVAGETTFELDDNKGLDLLNDFPDLRKEAEESPAGFPLNPEDIVVLDRGAALEELISRRKQMLDSDSESFWECEFVIDAKALDHRVTFVGDPNNPSQQYETESTVTPQELRALAASSAIDKYDFGVEIVIRLGRRETINFLVINPMNFSETAWLEVMEISTASDETAAFIPIEGFGDQLFENVLTDRANSELPETEQGVVMTTSPFAYRGQGVYSFPPRQASRVRIRLKQRTPVPSEYERIAIQLVRTLTATESKFKGSCFPAGSMVGVPGGQKKIEDLQVGDLVLSYDQYEQKITNRKITKILRHGPSPVVIVICSNGSLHVTPNHTMLTSRGWKQVIRLKTGDFLTRLRPGIETQTVVLSVSAIHNAPTYNLHTEGEHNFLVEDFVVHNFTFLRRIRTLWHRLFVDRRA